MNRLFSAEQEVFIRENAIGISERELCERFNAEFNTTVGFFQLKNFKTRNRILSGRNHIKWSPRKYTEEHFDFLREIIPGRSEQEIIAAFEERFGITLTVSMVGNLKVKTGAKSGTLGGRFRKGISPPNKGKKWTDFMTEEGMTNSRKTTFQKGQMPHNTTPIGTERFTKDGYIEVRVAEPKVYDYGEKQQRQYYRLKHRLIWEAANGPIPKGHNVIFLDTNPLNCSLDNLQLVSRAEWLRINRQKLFCENPELNTVALTIAKILVSADRKKKNRS